MRRKIPGKKHRGIKDPEKQRAKRLAGLESCTNAPPKDPDEQAIPKSLEYVIKLKEIAKNIGKQKKKNKKKDSLICVGSQEYNSNSNSKARPEKVVPVFQQKVGESEQQFWHRVTKDTHAFIKETEFEQKYGVEVVRNSETGLIQGLKKCKADKDIDELRAKHKNTGKKKKTLRTEEGTKKTLTKSEKRKLKLLAKKEQKLERQKENDKSEKLQDKVAFGEVAHEPPRLKIKKKIIDEERKPKNLLLSSMLGGKNVSPTSKTINRAGKRKKLPVAERRKLEKQQSDIIAAYKHLKFQRSTKGKS